MSARRGRGVQHLYDFEGERITTNQARQDAADEDFHAAMTRRDKERRGKYTSGRVRVGPARLDAMKAKLKP